MAPSARSTFKAHRTGTHRSRAPAETLELLAPHLAGMGITRIANVTGLDRIGVPVVMVHRPNSRSVTVSQGKGLDLDAAKASGAMEAIETWHAERILHPLKLASARELAHRHLLCDLERMPLVAESPFHHDLTMLWIEGTPLGGGEKLWLPYEMVHTDYTIPRPPGHGCFPASTNGLASGNQFAEAACHAICELIERDATSLWHQRRGRSSTRLDADSVDDPACRAVLAAIAEAKLDIAIWDTTSDIGVASFYCLMMEEGVQAGHMGAGAGCHPSRAIALLRALTEAVQTRLTYIAGARDDLTPREFSEAGVREKYAYARRMVKGEGELRRFADVPTSELETFEADLAFLLKRLASAGLNQVIAVDLSRDELPVSVVRVVVPGIEAPHDEEDYVPGPRANAAGGASP